MMQIFPNGFQTCFRNWFLYQDWFSRSKKIRYAEESASDSERHDSRAGAEKHPSFLCREGKNARDFALFDFVL